MPLLVPKAELVGTCMEMLGYGVYLIISVQCARVLYTKYSNGKCCVYLSAVALTIFGLVTSHLMIDLVRIVAAFTDNMGTPNGPATYYVTRASSQINVAKNALYCTVTLVSDALIIYRFFAVWDYNYCIVIVPLLAFFAEIGTSVWLIQTIRQLPHGDKSAIARVLVPSKYFYILTFILNLSCTFGISYKIWTIQRGISRYAVGSASHLKRVISVMVESVAIYSVWSIALILANALNPPVSNLLLDSICPVIGMACSAVIIRVLKDRSTRSTTDTFTTDGSALPTKTCEKCSKENRIIGNIRTMTTHMHPDGVQITLDTVTHSEKDVGVEKLESQTSGSYGHGDDLA